MEQSELVRWYTRQCFLEAMQDFAAENWSRLSKLTLEEVRSVCDAMSGRGRSELRKVAKAAASRSRKGSRKQWTIYAAYGAKGSSGKRVAGPSHDAPKLARGSLPASRNLHKLRHTFCSHLAMGGVPMKAIQVWAGHADLKTTQRYVHLSPEGMDGMISVLERGAGLEQQSKWGGK